MECKILKNRNCKITQYYSDSHKAIDIVGESNNLDYIIAHSSGKIIEIQDGLSNIKGSIGSLSYGNYIIIEHINGYKTLYAHMKNGLNFRKNQYVKEGDILGYMDNSGNANGKHLHFEVLKNNQRINPLEYLNKSFPEATLEYKVGDIVEIKGVYISSDSNKELKPLITTGIITKIIPQAKNPYLLDDGKIGWVNNEVIISKTQQEYLSNPTYTGVSIVDALKEINMKSSYQYRKDLAKKNNINNYTGTAEQNSQLLNLLKKGILKNL